MEEAKPRRPGPTSDQLAARRRAYVGRLEEAVRDLAERLPRLEGVRRVSLVGSYARGRRDLMTDLDVIVVMESDLPFTERVARLYRQVGQPVDMDLLCYTPEEFGRMAETPFLRHALRDEVVLWESGS